MNLDQNDKAQILCAVAIVFLTLAARWLEA
jgi:hypothetical protein